MKKIVLLGAAAAATMFLAGCETVPPGVERGPQGTIAYDVLVDASPPGAKIEVNGQVVGNSPVHVKVFGDKDGTFHDFGSYYYIFRALPLVTNQYQQERAFGTGRHFSHEDMIPDRVYFDMTQPMPQRPPTAYPAYGGPPVYYGPPAYYGPPVYYGPAFRFEFGGRGWHRHW